MSEDVRRMMEEEFDIRTIVTKTAMNLSTCKYLYNSIISEAVVYTARQLGISLTEDQKEEAALRVSELLMEYGL